MSTTILSRQRLPRTFIHQHTHLTDDVPVGEADNHPVLGGIIFVLVLDDQAFAGKVVSFSLCEKEIKWFVNKPKWVKRFANTNTGPLHTSYLSSSWTSPGTSWNRPCSSLLLQIPVKKMLHHEPDMCLQSITTQHYSPWLQTWQRTGVSSISM